MLKLDLKPNVLASLERIIRTYLPLHEVWAFGSRVKQQAHSGSDLDLVIRNPLQLNKASSELAAFKSALRDSNIPILIDVVDWASIPEAFRQEILKQYQLVYSGFVRKR